MTIATDTATRIMANARMHLPGALDSAIKLQFFEVLQEFFNRTDCWFADTVIQIVPGQQAYDISSIIPAGARIARLILAVTSAASRSPAYLQLPATIMVPQVYYNVDTVHVWVSFTVDDPTDTATGYPGVPNEIVERYQSGLVDGVVGRMQMQPNKTYTSDTLGLFHWRRFNAVVGEAKAEAARGFRLDGQSWMYPQSFHLSRGRNR